MSSVAIGPLPAVTHALQRFGPKEEVPPWSKEITMLVIKCLLVEGNGYEKDTHWSSEYTVFVVGCFYWEQERRKQCQTQQMMNQA